MKLKEFHEAAIGKDTYDQVDKYTFSSNDVNRYSKRECFKIYTMVDYTKETIIAVNLRMLEDWSSCSS